MKKNHEFKYGIIETHYYYGPRTERNVYYYAEPNFYGMRSTYVGFRTSKEAKEHCEWLYGLVNAKVQPILYHLEHNESSRPDFRPVRLDSKLWARVYAQTWSLPADEWLHVDY